MKKEATCPFCGRTDVGVVQEIGWNRPRGWRQAQHNIRPPKKKRPPSPLCEFGTGRPVDVSEIRGLRSTEVSG